MGSGRKGAFKARDGGPESQGTRRHLAESLGGESPLPSGMPGDEDSAPVCGLFLAGRQLGESYSGGPSSFPVNDPLRVNVV